ncbi:lipopolysaccharide biosynthesis protein [Vibrio coralliirubri]|uniref:lipopolysaccharide biosynthesis protein n=1 Tax=Vibrio coralliirubri TaxID=1516159 RepID=UPI000769D789|nr:lipopolysaccharide biosynthesis protein [Vibrio coralliirubri]
MASGLYQAIVRSVAGKFSSYIVQFLFLVVYARIFTPEQFGLLASIQVFVLFFQLLSNMGIGPAIINEEKFSTNQRDGVFTVTVLLGISFSLIFYLSSQYFTLIYKDLNVSNLIPVVSLSILFSTLTIVPLTSFNKDARFITIAKIEATSEIMSFFVVYSLYKLNFGVIALAARNLSFSSIKFFLLWYLSYKTTLGRCNFGREIQHFLKIGKFAGYQFAFNVINYFSRNLDTILIAKYFGAASLGVYDKAYQLMRYPLQLTTFAMTPAIQPTLTKFRNDKKTIIKEHNKLTQRLSFLSVLISAFIFFNSQSIVLILFGPQWISVAPLIEIFSFMIPIQSVLSTSGAFFQVMNRPDLLFVTGVISAIFNVIAIVIGIYLGDLSLLAKMLCVSFAINFIQCYFILFRWCFNENHRDFYIRLLKSLLFSLSLAAIYHIISECFVLENNSIYFSLTINLSIAVLVLFAFKKQVKKLLY